MALFGLWVSCGQETARNGAKASSCRSARHGLLVPSARLRRAVQPAMNSELRRSLIGTWRAAGCTSLPRGPAARI